MEIIYNLDTVNNRAVLALDVEGVPLAPRFLSFAEVGGLTVQYGDEFQIVTKETYKGSNPDVLAFFARSPEDENFGLWHAEDDKVVFILKFIHEFYIKAIKALPYEIGVSGYLVFDRLWHSLSISTFNKVEEISEDVHEFVEECCGFLNQEVFEKLGDIHFNQGLPDNHGATITTTLSATSDSVDEYILYLDKEGLLQSVTTVFDTPEIVSPPLPIKFSLVGAISQTQITSIPTPEMFAWKVSITSFENLEQLITPIQI